MTQPGATGSARSVRIVGRVVDVLLLVVIAIGLTSVILGRLLPALGHPVYVVGGPSMSPGIPMGAAVVLTAAPAESLVIGDVVSLKSGERQAVFTHRIVRVAEHDGQIWIETKGDANPAADPALSPSTAVIGRVTTSIPLAGYVLALLSTLSGLLLVLSTGALLLLLGWWLDDLAAARGSTAPGVAPVELPEAAGSVSAVDRVRTDRSGRRRRQRTGVARSRP